MSHASRRAGLSRPEPFQARHQSLLEAFFERQGREQWAFGECAGFLVAVHCAPEMVPPSEWLPMVLDGIEFRNESEAEQVLGALMALYNWIGERIEHEQLPIPAGYEPRSRAMDNFEPDNPFDRWSSGLMSGHGWLGQLWAAHVPGHEDVTAGVMMPVGFLGDIDRARDWYGKFFDQRQTFEQVAEGMVDILPEALIDYAKAGRQALMAAMQHEPERSIKVGRNEPCPCGSGRKYKKCCLGRGRQEPPDTPGTSVVDEITSELQGRDFSSHAELDAEVQRITRARNRAPRAEFEGLSPEQMFRLLNHPFDSPELVRFADCLKREPQAPILGLVKRIIDAIGDKGLKATAKGNLPRQFCIDALDEHTGYTRPEPMAEYIRLRSETDYRDLHHARVVAELAGLIELRKGRFRVCNACREMIAASGYRAVYPRLFKTFVKEYNWAYGDGHPDAPIAQQSFAYTLYLLGRHGADWRDSEFYENAFVRAFPAALDLFEDEALETAEQSLNRLYRFRVLIQFAEFLGLVEIKRLGDKVLNRDIRVRRLPLLSELAEFSPLNPESGGLH